LGFDSLPDGMKVAILAQDYERQFLEAGNDNHRHELFFLEPLLSRNTASLASGFPAVCMFVNDQADAATLDTLALNGTCLIALRWV